MHASPRPSCQSWSGKSPRPPGKSLALELEFYSLLVKEALSQGELIAKTAAALAADLPLFSAATAPQPAKVSEAEEALKALNSDALSPREALEALYRLKEMLKG